MTLNIAVIFGGKSVEHEVSVISANQCINAIDKNKYQVIPIYISKQGQWYTGEQLLNLKNYRDIDKLLSTSQKIIVDQNADKNCFYKEPCGFFARRKSLNIDVAFPVMHGTYGEDGILQGLLAMMNIPYVGCDVLASAITMDKVSTKILLTAAGIKVLDYFWFYSEEWINDKDKIIAALRDKFAYPLIVKPGNLGSSVGVSAVNNDSELEDAVDLVISLSQRVLIEPQVVNLREVNCAVLGDRDFVEVSICEEPIRSVDILSYRDKYFGGLKNKTGGCKNVDGGGAGGMQGAKRKIPAEISTEVSTKIQAIAKRAFINLDCSGVARIDFLIDQNTQEIYLCELNTIPGSLAFYLWEPEGKSFTALTEQLITLALKRHREVNNLVLSHKENILKGW